MSEVGERRLLSFLLMGKGILNPCETGKLDERVRCIREYGVNLYFYETNNQIIMIDTGYLEYPHLRDKMQEIDLEPAIIKNILITHADPDHVGGIDDRGTGLFDQACVYISDIENHYLEGKATRRLLHTKAVRRPQISNMKKIVHDQETIFIGDIKVQCFLTPGHTKGLMCYLIDDEYLFCGDCVALGPDGGYNFMWFLNVDTGENIQSVRRLQNQIKQYPIKKIFTPHTGMTDSLEFMMRHVDENRRILFTTINYNEKAPYDLYAKEE